MRTNDLEPATQPRSRDEAWDEDGSFAAAAVLAGAIGVLTAGVVAFTAFV